ncbi:MAG: enoyl-CoA hydratase family protein [Gammaproteobacteria bacterium]|nr:enoyl-CoA hydratase family protein [Gammaproteobacteria bacterium]
MMAFSTQVHDGVAHIVLNKPPVNAFNSDEWAQLAAELRALGQQDATRVILISAEGKGFCAGVDIKELGADPAKIVPVNKGNYDTFEAIHRNPKPVVMAIHGFVLGGGIGMAGAADILVASECATFGVPEVDRGAMGGGAHLQRLFSLQKVRHMYFTGEFIDAQEAWRLGAIEKVVPLSELLPTAMAIAKTIAEKSPPMIALAKEALNAIEDGNLEEKYRREQGLTLEAYMHPDSQEARDAFNQNREADFKNSSD